jgi:drug/metabolite transporter (DMT)-like permease
MPVGVLTFWMLVVTLPFLLLGTLLLERDWRLPNAVEWGAIAYNAVVVFAYCHLVWFMLARSLPPVVSSLSMMFIPVVGVFSGMWMLGEQPHWQDYAAIVLMFCAMASVLLVPLVRRWRQRARSA